MAQYFVLLANMRTGSNLFESHINQFEDIHSAGELFNPNFIGFPDTSEAYGVSMEVRERDPIALLHAFLEQSDRPISGFRLFSDHDPRVLTHCLADRSCHKIILTRNILSSFVSLQIAQATDQWKMLDFHARKEAKIHFDMEEFIKFSEQRTQFANEIKSTLQTTGQTAFHLDYDDLNNVKVINGTAKFLGSSQTVSAISETLKRQNPQSLSDKVSNFEEMQRQLSTLDVYAEQKHIPLEAIRKPGVPNFVAAQNTSLLYLPLGDTKDARIVNWIASHDPQGITQKLNRKLLSSWLTKHVDHQIFVTLTHPVERAYDAFERKIFLTSDDTMMGLRMMLERNYNLIIPESDQLEAPIRSECEAIGYTLDAHRTAFGIFLEFLRGNILGQTRARIDNAWATQTSLVHGLNKVAHPHHILRPDQVQLGLRQIELSLGLPKQVIANPPRDSRCFPLSDVYTPDFEKRVRDIYAQDYKMFGFADWYKTKPN